MCLQRAAQSFEDLERYVPCLACLGKVPNATAGSFVVEDREPIAGSVAWRAGSIRWPNWPATGLLP